jgi:hypothetical protein
MTWNLAESSKEFVTTVVNKNDVVPSFGKASVANLRIEVPNGYIVFNFQVVMVSSTMKPHFLLLSMQAQFF